MLPIQIAWPVASATAIAAAQTLAGAGAMVLNGPYVQQNMLPYQTVAKMSDAYNRKITLTSTGNISGVNFTIVGKTYNGTAVTEVLAGPNNNTVTSLNDYYEIDSVTANGAVGTATSIGTGTSGNTTWIKGNTYSQPNSAGLYIGVTATTINVTVEGTPDDPALVTPQLFPHAILASITANDSSEWPYGVNYVRFKVNSSDATGAARFSVIEDGY